MSSSALHRQHFLFCQHRQHYSQGQQRQQWQRCQLSARGDLFGMRWLYHTHSASQESGRRRQVAPGDKGFFSDLR